MERIKIDLLQAEQIISPKKPRTNFKNKSVRIIFYLLIFGIIGLIAFSYQVTISNTSLDAAKGENSLLNQVKNFIGWGNDSLAGEVDDRVNILLLGIGGAGHEGPELTDTIILLSFKPSTKEVALTSLPRDLIIWQDEFGWRKINHANALGENKFPGEGAKFASQMIAQTFDLPIHYYIKIDFNGLKKIVDILDGLEIEVAQTFTDPLYPTEDNLTESLTFYAGKQTMNGKKVLQFVRSRHGNNGEGSDFARGRRQQLVLQSLKKQALSLNLLANPLKINKILKTIDANIVTNLQQWEIARLAGIANDIPDEKMYQLTLDDSPNGMLISKISSEGAYILIPRQDSFSEISFNLKYIFTEKNQRPQPIKIAIHNGTNITGLASAATQALIKQNLYISQVANAPNRDLEKTTIYKLTGRADKETMDKLIKIFDANTSLGLPNWLSIDNNNQNTNSSSTPIQLIPESDILIILGTNASKIMKP